MFPYVPEYVKEYHNEYDQEFNNGGTVHISSYFRGYTSVGGSSYEYWWAPTKEVKNPSGFAKLTGYVGVAKPLADADFQYVFNSIFDHPHTESYYKTTEYQEAYERVNNNLTFIWGDINAGGLCCYKPTSDTSKITFYIINGYFSKIGENEEKLYGYSFGFMGGHTISRYDWDKVNFRYNASEAADGDIYQCFATMCFPEKANENKVTIGGLEFDPYGYDTQIALGDYDLLASLGTDWYDPGDLVFNADPMFIFNCQATNEETRDMFGHFDFSILTHLYGNPFADMKIDDDSNPYSDTGFTEQSGGGASLDNNTDTNAPEDDNASNIPYDAITSGAVKVYNPTSAQIADFNSFLYSGITDSIATTLKKLTSDPLQYIISLGMVHFTPSSSASHHITFGGIDTEVDSKVVNKQYMSFDFGSIDLKNEFKSFIDFQSRVSIFLPYIGQRELDINELRGSRIRLVYNVDIISGSTVAYLHISRASRGSGDCKIYHTMYSFEGNCLTQIPMFATDNRGAIQALLSVAGAGVSLATGNVAGAVTGAVGALTQEKISVGRAGSMSSNYGYIARQKPALIVERPIITTPINFGAFEGWTSHIRRRIGSLSGYTEVDPDTLWTDNIPCTEAEAEEIRTLFNNGVYL